MRINFDEIIIFIFIFSFTFLFIYSIIFDFILPVIEYFLDDCSAIKKELIKIGVKGVEFAQFKRVKIYRKIYKSSIPLTIDGNNKNFQYFELWDMFIDFKVVFILYPTNIETITKNTHKEILKNPLEDIIK